MKEDYVKIIASVLQDNVGNRLTSALGNGMLGEISKAFDMADVSAALTDMSKKSEVQDVDS